MRSRTRIIAIAVALAAAPALAQDRPAWDAELWSMEEGERLVASVTSVVPADDELPPTLALLCGENRNSYRLRYDPGEQADDATDWSGQSAAFEFSSGPVHVERELQFEALDAMWAVSLPADDPLVGLIRSGSEMQVSMPAGGVAATTFSLKGSSAAIAEMRKSCR